jgi:nitrite reductase/ring-hydroxylating ferredoxin subunit
MTKRITVAKTTEIPLNEARAFPVGDRMVAIFNQAGVFHAMDDFCPHMGASLAGGWIRLRTGVGWTIPRSKRTSFRYL